MSDGVVSEARSRNMAAIRGRNTKPEMAVRRYLHSQGFRFRLHRKDLPGKPDIILPKYRVAIFVHGCFWHRHCGCFYSSTPKSRQAFWVKKFNGNMERDRKNINSLLDLGWRVMVVWECGIKHCSSNLKNVSDFVESDELMFFWPPAPPRLKN